jgi:hypothetical protein
VDDQHRQELLRSSAAYAIGEARICQRDRDRAVAGETDEEIAHVTGYTVPMIRAVLRTPA